MIAIREVLFPTDLSPESDRAFDHARFLADRFQASLTLYHAVQVPDHRLAHWAFAHDLEFWERAEKEARCLLQRRAGTLSVSHQIIVERTASVARSLLEQIRRTQPDLTVLAAHNRGGFSHLLMGGVTEEVVQHAFRPLLCVRENHALAPPYQRILVPTDLSLASRLAFPMAALFARTFRAGILGVHVVPSLATLSGVPAASEASTLSENSLRKFFSSDFRGLEVTAQIHTGSVCDRIVQAAHKERADLIVMSTHGHDSLADSVLGSNTERVVRHAPCPVLVT